MPKISLTLKRIILFSAIFLNLTAFISLFTKATNMDEGILAAHSYFLEELGHVKSDHYHNADFDWEQRQYHYHKLFVWQGVIIYKLFGFHLLSFRLCNYLFYLLFLFFLYYYIKLEKLPFTLFWIFQILFLIHNLSFQLISTYRPEMAVMTFGFLSYIFLKKGIDTSKLSFSIFSGLSAGIAVLYHLNGIAFIIAGTLFFLINKKVLMSLLFGSFASIVCLIYFIDLLSPQELLMWKTQFFADPNLIEKKAFPILKVFDEQMRFFHSEREAIFSILLLFSLWFGFKKIREYQKGIILYFALMVFALSLIAHGITPKYMLIYMPYIIIIIGITLFTLREFQLIKKIILLLCLGVVLLFNIWFIGGIFSESYNVVNRNRYLAEIIPEKNTLVFANEGFVFNEIDKFIIQSPCAYNFYIINNRGKIKASIEGFFNFLNEGGTKYVIIDDFTETGSIFAKIPKEKLKINSIYYNYKVIHKDQNVMLFVRVEN